MTVREQLHHLIDKLDDESVGDALVYLDGLVSARSTQIDGTRPAGGVEIADRDALLRLAQPITVDDPLWAVVGMIDVDDGGPTDVSSNTHQYLADAYTHPPRK